MNNNQTYNKNSNLYKLLLLICLISNLICAQTIDSKEEDIYKIRLKSREFTPSKNVTESMIRSIPQKNHILMQFNDKLSSETIKILESRGVRIDSWVSPTTLAVNIKDAAQLEQIKNVRWIGTIENSDKISEKLVYLKDEAYVIVELHSSLHKSNYLDIIKNTGAQVLNNLYLHKNTLLLKVSSYSLNELSNLDGVAFIYPASKQIIEGKNIRQCPGAFTPYGHVAAFAKAGEGWDGPGLGSADLNYYWVNGTPDVVGENSEVLAAMLLWSDYADISWSRASMPGQARTIDVYWVSELPWDSDDETFGEPNGTLAYGIYPSDISGEPYGGNIYFDEAETWEIGKGYDIYSISLHEVGHALGLDHSDDTDAVMYASYSSAFGDLREDDINGIRALYRSINTPRAPAPIFDPSPGNYGSPIEVRLQYGTGSNMDNTQLKYTIDGSEPTAYSLDIVPEFGDYIYQRLSNTVKARAFRIDHTPSEVVEATYILTPATPTVAIPSMVPEGGSFTNSVEVTLESETEFTVIRYTTNGTEPTQSSFAYGGPLTFNSSLTLKAKGFRNDYAASPTVSADFEIFNEVVLPSPTIYPAAGAVFAGPVSVYLGSTVLGAIIRYTLDGSDPNESSTIFNNPILISNTSTIKARTFLDGYTESEVTEGTYYIVGKVTDPIITPAGGNFTGNVQISIETSTPNATIRYTTNGTEPTITSEVYTQPFTLSTGNHWVCAKAFLDGADPSSKVCANFDVFNPSASTVETPTMAPFSTQIFVNEIPISMDCRTEGATIRYTVGTNILPHDPTESGPGALTYTDPFNFGVPDADVSFFFKVRAFKDGLNPSAIIQSGALQLVVPLGKMNKPTITPNGGVFHNSVQVTLETTSDFAQLIYTDDGGEPNSLLPILPPTKKFNSSFNLFQSKIITAKAFRKFFEDSDTTKAEFVFMCAAPVITPESADYIDSVEIIITTETINSKIKFTLDGTFPNENSAEYSEPLRLGLGTYSLKAKAFRNNFLDSESSSAEFVVKKAAELPNIINNLQDIVATEGEKVVFKIEAIGTPRPSFQWQRNQVNLPQETADSLVFENIQLGDAGQYRVIVENSAGNLVSNEITLSVNSITDVDEIVLEGIPTDYKLYGNYPNPFNPSTRIKYGIPEESSVSLKVFNILGENVITLTNEIKNSGYYEKNWDASNLSSGVYFLQFDALSTTSNNQISSVHKLLLIK